MAEIYLALSGELSGFRTLVVLKRILPHLAANEQFVRMFLDEARIEARLDHPNVVRIIEVGHDGDEYFLAMELVQGKPLSTVLRRASREKTPLLPALAAYVVSQAASGLGYAHTMIDAEGHPMQIVHRDVSPQNILVSFEGAVKVIDFGIARAQGRGTHTNPGGLKGKIQYMSPEQASAGEVDPRSDVFALGVVLWEILVGQRLFYRENELAMMRAVVDEPIPAPSQLVPTPPELEAIVMRALDRDPDRRFHTAQEMGLALERFAFTNGAFSPQQLGTYMKLLFASDFLQWKRTVATAMEMEVTPPRARRYEQPVDNSELYHARDYRAAAGNLDMQSSGATMSLGPALPEPGAEPQTPDSATETPVLPAAESLVHPTMPSAYDRLWVYGGIATLAMISIAGVLVLSQPRGGRRADGSSPPLAATRFDPAPPARPARPEPPPVTGDAPTPNPVRPSPVAALQPPAAAAPASLPAVAAPATVATVPAVPPGPGAIPPAPAVTLPPAIPVPPSLAPPPAPVAVAPAGTPVATEGGKKAGKPIMAANASRPSTRHSAKEQRAARARAAKLSLTSASRNRRLSIRELGRLHPKAARAPNSPATRGGTLTDDAPMPMGRLQDAKPLPVSSATAPSADHKRNPFD